MPSPVTPAQFSAIVPSPTSDICDRIYSTLIQLPSLISSLISWMFDSTGGFTDAFKFMVASVTHTPGDYKFSASNIQPAGWRLADGSAVSRTTYSILFANIGTINGAGDGSTTFNLPNASGRALVGTGQGTGLTSRIVGDVFGEEAHTIVEAELPAHYHTMQFPQAEGTQADPSASRFLYTPGTVESGSSGIGGGGADVDTFPQVVVATSSIGSGVGASVIQPSLGAYCYIFTGVFS